jgi:YVTN family beta-propeller protein
MHGHDWAGVPLLLSVARTAWLTAGKLLMSCLLTLLWALDGAYAGPDQHVWSAPARLDYCQIDPGGTSIIPNGRLLTPRGKQILVEPHPYGMRLSADGKTLITVNSGTAPFSFSILQDPTGNPRHSTIPDGVKTKESVLNACFMGIAIPTSGPTGLFYASGGDDGTVMVWNHQSKQRIRTIDLNVEFRGRSWADSYTGAMVLSTDEQRLYVVDQMNFRVVALDTTHWRITDVVPVGRYPFGIARSADGKRIYVANVGMFQYSAVEGFDPERFAETGLRFPPFAYLSREMEFGTVAEGKRVPGLGDPNAEEAVSIYALDLQRPDQGQVVAKIKTGVLVGQPVEGIPALGGSAPNSIACSDQQIYVSNGNNDSITVIDSATLKIVQDIPLRLPGPLGRYRGIIPFGLTLAPDGSRLYVAEAGINAVAVIDTTANSVLGHIPVGWFPSQVAVSPDQKFLLVSNAKGFGSGPNGGPGVDLGGRSGIGNLMRGTVSIIPIPTPQQLVADTRQVLQNNVHISTRPSPAGAQTGAESNPIPPYPGAYQSPIRYTVFIAKENRTFDQVFGQLPNARAEPSLADFGLGVTVQSGDRPGDVLHDMNVMPNHQRLARQFASSDNFYCDSDHSADGHRWLQGVYPGVFCETSNAASYGGRRRHLITSSAPGRRGVVGASAGLIPEDYLLVGTLWDHWERGEVSFFNFGLGFEMPAVAEDGGPEFKDTGVRIASNYPLPAPLMEHTSRRFATYNTNIPDQYRVDMFEQDLKERWLSGQEPMPRIITMSLPQDHGAGERPEAGYPYYASYMADNDLALARVVSLLSRTPYWREMAIFVTEDDAQNGRDHIDAHRSLCMVISPYAKKNYVSHVHTSIPSIIKTIHLIHGLPFINLYDAMASDLSDCFQPVSDKTPYTAVKIDPRLFDPEKAFDPLDEEFDWSRINDFPAMDDPAVMRKWMREDLERRKNVEKEINRAPLRP